MKKIEDIIDRAEKMINYDTNIHPDLRVNFIRSVVLLACKEYADHIIDESTPTEGGMDTVQMSDDMMNSEYGFAGVEAGYELCKMNYKYMMKRLNYEIK